MTRPPPPSPLFPYTTLSRSPFLFPLYRDGPYRPATLRLGLALYSTLARDGIGEGRVEGDRKSTRLNSSHSQSSYAVFCLKKKNGDCRVGAGVIFYDVGALGR